MTGQFADLFDKEKYGLNYWAGIMVAVGILVGFVFDAGEYAYDILVTGLQYSGMGGEPLTLGDILVSNLRYTVSSAIGFGVVLVASATLVKKDLHLPFLAGVLAILWGIAMRITGIEDSNTFSVGIFVSNFLASFLTIASLVLLYRFLHNKLMALSLGAAMGSLLMMVYAAIRFHYPLEFAAEFTAKEIIKGFIAGVFLFAGIAMHLSSRGIYFGEFGLDSEGRSATAASTADPNLGKTRRPLVTLLLMLVTLNLYIFGWVYKTFKEIRQRDSIATTVSQGRALGFLFVPIFNFFWAIWIFYEIPRAVGRLQNSDPPAGHPPKAWLITGSYVGCIVAGLASNFWFPALYLNGVLLWTSVLLAQSSLNSHWRAHRTISAVEEAS